MMPGEHYQPMVEKVEKEVTEHPETQYIILTDLYGGSVCNGMTMLAGYPNVRLLAGMNMGLVINILLTPGQISDELLDEIVEESRASLRKVEPIRIKEEDEEFF